MPRRYNEQDDVLTGFDGAYKDASLLDFWRWAFSDLCDDDIKGIFAEWMILKVLDIPSLRRVSWSNSDLKTKSGVTIEVKATSYWQSWKLVDSSGRPHEKPVGPKTPYKRIQFAGLSALTSEPDSSRNAPKSQKAVRSYKSDLYFLAFQNEEDTERWDAMDLTQWQFHALYASELTGRSMTIEKVKLKCGELNATEFVAKAKAMIAEIELRQKA